MFFKMRFSKASEICWVKTLQSLTWYGFRTRILHSDGTDGEKNNGGIQALSTQRSDWRIPRVLGRRFGVSRRFGPTISGLLSKHPNARAISSCSTRIRERSSSGAYYIAVISRQAL